MCENETMGGVNKHWKILKIFLNISKGKGFFSGFL